MPTIWKESRRLLTWSDFLCGVHLSTSLVLKLGSLLTALYSIFRMDLRGSVTVSSQSLELLFAWGIFVFLDSQCSLFQLTIIPSQDTRDNPVLVSISAEYDGLKEYC